MSLIFERIAANLCLKIVNVLLPFLKLIWQSLFLVADCQLTIEDCHFSAVTNCWAFIIFVTNLRLNSYKNLLNLFGEMQNISLRKANKSEQERLLKRASKPGVPFPFDKKCRFEFPEISSNEWNIIFRNFQKRGQSCDVAEIFGDFLPGMSVPF